MISIVLLIGAATALSVRFRKNIEDTLVSSAMLYILFIYGISSVFSMNIAFHAAVIAGVVSILYASIVFLRNRHELKKYIFRNGLLALLLFMVLFMIMCNGRGLMDYDDLTFWGLQVKDMFYRDGLRNKELVSLHPPAMEIWNYFTVKSWRGFSESICLYAQCILEMILLIPLFRFTNKEHGTVMFISEICTVFLFPIMMLSGVYFTLNADVILGTLILDGIIYFVLFMKEYSRAYLVNSIFTLTIAYLTKKAGFLLVVLILPVIYVLLMQRTHPTFSKKSTGVKISVVYCTTILAAVISWDGLGIYAAAIVAELLVCYVLAVVIDWYLGKLPVRYRPVVLLSFVLIIAAVFCIIAPRLYLYDSNAIETTRNFFVRVFTSGSNSYGALVPLSFAGLFVVLSLIWVSFEREYLKNRISVEERHMANCIVLYIPVATVIYLFALLYEKYILLQRGIAREDWLEVWSELPSLGRYLLPCVVVFTGILVFMLVLYVDKQMNYYCFLILICVFFLTADTSSFINSLLTKWGKPEFYGFEKAGIELSYDDTVYFIDEVDDYSYRDASFYYYIYPATSNLDTGLLSDTIKEAYPSYIEVEQEIESGYDYVYLQSYDDSFVTSYGDLFENENDIGTGQVYSVSVDDGQIKLVLCR